MVARKDIARIVSGYENPRIGVLGSHSALEIMDGAKDENFQTVVFCQKGREAPYKKFSRIADEIIVMNKFSDMASVKAQKKMISTNTIVVPHRSLTAYLGYEAIEKKLPFQCLATECYSERDEKRKSILDIPFQTQKTYAPAIAREKSRGEGIFYRLLIKTILKSQKKR